MSLLDVTPDAAPVVLVLLAGASPSVLRILPSVALRVPPDPAEAGTPLHLPTIERATVRASGFVTAGTVAVAVLAAVGFGVGVRWGPAADLARWALLADGVLLAGALGLASRAVRPRVDRRVLHAAAGVVTVETACHLIRLTGDTRVLVVASTLLAFVVLGVAFTLDTGWRSVRIARTAELLGGLCVAGSLPVALLAAGVAGVVRRAVA